MVTSRYEYEILSKDYKQHSQTCQQNIERDIFIYVATS